MSLIGGVIRRSDTHVPLVFANACLTGSFNCASTDGNGIWNADWGYEGVNVTCSAGAGFHNKSVNFTSADIAYYPAYGINGYWKIVELDPQPIPPTSCFTGGTEITLGDGSSRPIEEIRVGDRVLGSEGTVNAVLGIETPDLGARRLYSLNGCDPFVTGEHPFLTETGWRCIDTDALRAEGSALEVAPLSVGDRVVSLSAVKVLTGAAGDVASPLLVAQPLHAIAASYADPGTTVYNLLLDGDHTYVANGFVVHNKGSH